MASIVQKPNGTYLIRIFCGTDENGKVISRARQFTPSRPDLPYHALPLSQKQERIFFENFSFRYLRFDLKMSVVK